MALPSAQKHEPENSSFFNGLLGEREMPELIDAPAVVEAAGTPPKRIEEYAGRVRSGHEAVSVARMRSPQGWSEPGGAH